MLTKRVLIVDDDRDSAKMLAALLRLRNSRLSTAVAHDGRAAVAMTVADRVDVVILDLEMPGLDGAATAAAIRDALAPAAPLLVALSGNVVRIAEAMRDTLFDHAFTKPVDVRALLRILEGGAGADDARGRAPSR